MTEVIASTNFDKIRDEFLNTYYEYSDKEKESAYSIELKNMKQTENFHYQREIAQKTVFKWETVQESVQDQMKQDSYSKYLLRWVFF